MEWLTTLAGRKSAEDPLQKLDPKLRDFLDRESSFNAQLSKPEVDVRRHPSQPTPRDANLDVPRGSLYKDGRYAGLWKTYRPLEAVEADAKSSHERLMDVLDGFKERKTMIAKAALENCAFQQEEWRKCMIEGSWMDTLQMCRDQAKQFERCYTMQSRFLRVLGYKADVGRENTIEEDIQLHADSLYQRMIVHESAATRARETGLPVPAFEIIPPRIASKAPVPDDAVTSRWRDQLDRLPEDERVAEEAALRADYEARSRTAEKVRELKEKDNEERKQRREEGRATMGDHIWGLIGSDSSLEGKDNGEKRA